MHVGFVFSGSSITDKEERLVRATCALAHVEKASVYVVPEVTGAAAFMERWRAIVERGVARTQLALVKASSLEGNVVSVQMVTRSALITQLAKCGLDVLVNLSGAPVDETASFTGPVLELWWDGVSPENLGILRAGQHPPHDVLVTRRASPRHERHVLERSTLTRTPGIPAADRRNAASRSLVLLLRALRKRSVSPTGAPFTEWSATHGNSVIRVARAVGVSVLEVVAALYRRTSRTIRRKDMWELKYRTDATRFISRGSVPSPAAFHTYRPPYDRFYADPVAFAHDGIEGVFFEEYPHALGRGVISFAELDANGKLGASQRILERPYHLSYPFVFRDAGHVFMIPENSGNRTVELYRCTQFPTGWTLEKTLLHDISATDATLHFDGERWWMFATVGEEGSYGWDELHLFMASQLTGNWIPHPANPVKCDARTARPAGPLFLLGGKLMRPTQDCSESYGGAVNLCEVELLTPTEFREREVGRLSPDMFAGADGLHTLTATEQLEVIDVRPRRRWRWARRTA